MKQRYERPVMFIEEFAVNRAIAGCLEKDVKFDCMMGQNTDTNNVITKDESCTNQAGLASGITVAVHKSSNGSSSMDHSNGTGGSWFYTSGAGWTYTAPAGTKGLLYICSDGKSNATFSTNKWSVNGSQLEHETGHTGRYHCQIAPIYNVADVIAGS